MYDFLYQDMQPVISLLADASELSLPQTQLALSTSLQAIVIALLSYQQHYQAPSVQKKLFTRSAVKELRQYNAMNFTTIGVTLYHRNDVTEAIFGNAATVMKASSYIAAQISARPMQVKKLLTSLSVLVLRELAILADYSQLNTDELTVWFDLQPQFLSAAFVDDYWYTLTNFQSVPGAATQNIQQAPSNYLKVIGRVPISAQQSPYNEKLVFAAMENIVIPHQRWLLQLAKIADIYLSRNRMRINSEPNVIPSRPLVSLGLISGNDTNTRVTASEIPIEYDRPVPLWKNPIIVIIVVIGILSMLAAFKYQHQQSNGVMTATDAVYQHDHPQERQQQDVAIVRVAENDDVNKNIKTTE